jgi:hypothetical protein
LNKTDMQTVQDLFDDIVVATGSKAAAVDAVRDAFLDLDLPENLPLASRSGGDFDVWTPEVPGRVARHLFPAIVAEVGLDSLVNRLEAVRDSSTGASPWYLPRLRSACSLACKIEPTVTVMQELVKRIREILPGDARVRLPVYKHIKDALESVAGAGEALDNKEKIDEDMRAAVTEHYENEGIQPSNESAWEADRLHPSHGRHMLQTIEAMLKKVQTIKDARKLLAELDADIKLLEAIDPLKTKDFTEAEKQVLQSMGGRRAGGAFGGLRRYSDARADVVTHANMDRLVKAVLTGDARIVALLDALRVDLTAAQKMQVANAYLACKGSHCGASLEDVVRKQVGDEAADKVRASGLI